jgi:hypothetical protein
MALLKEMQKERFFIKEKVSSSSNMDEIQYEKILKFQGKIDNLIIMFAFIIIRFLPIIYIYFSLSICIHVL